MRATAVLITKEKAYPEQVLDSLPYFDEVIVETECPNIYRRYELARKAKNDVVYVQDDDCIVDARLLFWSYDGRLTNAITAHHKASYEGTGMTLVGFGCFFPRGMADFSRYLAQYPPDPLFLSQADRVFTFLNQPHRSIVMPIQHLPSATAPDRMSTQGDHWDNLSRIRARLAAM